jgi:hypothetical protein
MSDEPGFAFAPPPFEAGQALQQLQRDLRALKLSERGQAFELRGKRVVELQLCGTAIEARMARKPALTPEWDRKTITRASDQRQWLTELKQRLQRWEREE